MSHFIIFMSNILHDGISSEVAVSFMFVGFSVDIIMHHAQLTTKKTHK